MDNRFEDLLFDRSALIDEMVARGDEAARGHGLVLLPTGEGGIGKTSVVRQVQADGDTHLDADPLVIYYGLLGAASLLYVNAPEATHLLGTATSTRAVTDGLVDIHADTLVAVLLGPRPTPGKRPRIRSGALQ